MKMIVAPVTIPATYHNHVQPRFVDAYQIIVTIESNRNTEPNSSNPRMRKMIPANTPASENEPNTSGSQFALIFKDSEMEPQSTVLGTIDQSGLTTLDNIARAGIAGNRQSGAPTNPVKITAVRLS